MNEVFKKALEDGVYVKEYDGIVWHILGEDIKYDDTSDTIFFMDEFETDIYSITTETNLTMADYGKTWALTKEELL